MADSRPPLPTLSMKTLSKILICLFLPSTAIGGDVAAIQNIPLDDRVVYTVPVSTNRVTTVSFPSPISAIDAAGVTTDPKVQGQFQLAHTRGSAFLSVRALAPKSAANLNVRWNKRTYVFELIESHKPVLSLILEEKTEPAGLPSGPELSPTKLLSLLDKAKTYPLLKKQHPEVLAEVDVVTYTENPSVTDFDDYEIRLEEVYRFNREDTLVFRATLKNKTQKPIGYRPGSFSVRAGNRIYPQSVSDAPGVLPPSGESTVYFAVTGTPDGGRNELSLKNSFSAFLERVETSEESQ